MHELFDPDQVFRIVDIAAVVANGLLGGAVARAFRFDIVGFLLLETARRKLLAMVKALTKA